MARSQARNTTKKPASGARKAPARRTAAKAAPAARKTAASRTAKPKAAAPARKAATTAAARPASMTGPLPPIVTLKHLAEWAGFQHGVPKKQATEMFASLVEDIGRVLKKGSKIRIPNLGILQVRVRPARPARKGRNPATGEEIMIKATRPSKKIAFRVAKALKESI